ncbi:MAG: LysR family transcriptional regulator [Agarilytica sp.]
MNLRNIDLNLLTIFSTVYKHKNVSLAAKQLCMSQSAVSAALGRMRTSFNDELFIRASGGMVPTSRAVELAPAIESILERIEETLYVEKDHDFSTLERRFTLAMSDYCEQMILPKLIQWISRNAPLIELSVFPLNETTLEKDCAEGRVDLALGYLPYLDKDFYCQNLVKDTFVTIVREDNNILNESWGLEAFLSLQHVSINLRALKGTAIDSALFNLNVVRRCVMRVPNFHSIPNIISGTDYAGDMPLKFLNSLKEKEGFKVLEFPGGLEVTYINQFWHERVNRNPAHQWLRKNIYNLCSAL